LRVFSERGIDLYEVGMKREISIYHDLVALIKIWKFIRRGKFDIVHAHSSKAGVLGRLAAKLCGVRGIIYTPHGYAFQYSPESWRGKFYMAIERSAALLCDHVLSVSEGERRETIGRNICRGSKVTVLENVVSGEDLVARRSVSEMKRELKIPGDAAVVGMVANFRPQKGYGQFIRSIPKIRRACRGTVFVIVGDGEEWEKVKVMIGRLGIGGAVRLTGNRENVGDYYQIFDVFVLSSLWEGMPYVILEAMASGLPIVATDICGNNELVEDGRNGFLVEAGSIDGIAERVINLLKNAEKRRVFGEESLAMIASGLSVEEWIREYEKFYFRVLENEKH
jgi:glycosyltransferase involved in cell wall biosynthesis